MSLVRFGREGFLSSSPTDALGLDGRADTVFAPDLSGFGPKDRVPGLAFLSSTGDGNGGTALLNAGVDRRLRACFALGVSNFPVVDCL